LRLRLETPTNDGLPDTRTLYTAATAPGLDAQHHFRTIGAAFVIDYRDQPQLAERGTFAGIALWHATASDTSDRSLDWSRLNADVQHFVRVRKGTQVIALRGVLSNRIDSGHTPMPFYLQPTLGGGKTLRGFGSYRLRGESLWAGTAEYRWRVHPRIEIAPFVDAGAVAPRFSDFRSASLEVTPGIGLRVVGGSRVIGRVDYAHSRDGHRVMFALGAPF
jgi:outer membrane protein assembly factor BamA